MKLSHIALAALSVVAFAAHAENADPRGQFAATVPAQASRAAVQADLAAYKKSNVNPWSTSYNPLKTFASQNSREQVRADYLASRNAVSAMTGEDSGSAWLSTRTARPAGTHPAAAD